MRSFRITALFFLTLLFNLFYGCDTPVNQNTDFFPEQSVDTLKLDVGFPFRSNQFNFEGKVYVCLYDLVTFKRAKLYDEEMNWIKTFSFDEFVSGTEFSLSGLEMINPDSLVILTDYQTNALIAINLKTKKKKTVFLNSLFPFPSVKPILEFNSSRFGGFKYEDEFVFKVSANPSSFATYYPEVKRDKYPRVLDSLNKKLPAYVTVSNPFGKVPRLKKIPYSRAFNESFADAYFFGMNYSFIGNNKIISVSPYQDYCDVYNIRTKKAVKKLISSKYTDISMSPRKWIEIEKASSALPNELSSNDLSSVGQIYRMFYDEKKNQYHFLILYSKERLPIKEVPVAQYIWQVYDENFVLLSEKEYAPTSLLPTTAIGTNKYIYFQHYDEKTYDPYEAVLVRYTF